MNYTLIAFALVMGVIAMSDATINGILVAIPATIASIGAFLLAWRAASAAAKAAAASIDAKTEVIGAKVDGHLGGLMADLAVEKEKVKGYEAQIAQMEAASQAAQDLALKQAPGAAPTKVVLDDR